LGQSGVATRSEATKFIRARRVTVDGAVVRDPAQHIDPDTASVMLDGQPVVWREFTYVMLNKPTGYVSATEDRGPTVMELLPPQFVRMGLFPCGRLDRDTTGWQLLTNDGQLSHRLLSPRRHVEKVYRFTCDSPLPDGAEERFAAGIKIDGGELCKPAILHATPDRTGGEITLTEGKYHQIKRMVEALGSHVTALGRVSFAGIPLDPALAVGEWREATAEEIERLRAAAD
jgi:16S rRNA pseudouridine516 synthase